jgi:hypothetical protein
MSSFLIPLYSEWILYLHYFPKWHTTKRKAYAIHLFIHSHVRTKLLFQIPVSIHNQMIYIPREMIEILTVFRSVNQNKIDKTALEL